jgi:hypothetical protein
VPSPRGLAFDDRGRLLLVTGKQVKRYELVPGQPKLREETTIVAEGLEDPCQVLVAGDALYVSDWGASHQVKIFGLDGKFRRAIGRPGGAQVGAYDEEKMGSPYQMALAPDGTLWVAESEYAPKRISLWEAAGGRFLRAIYGGTKYAGGGCLDPRDRSVFYQSDHYVNGNCGIRFQLDWQAGTYKPHWIYYRGPRLKFEKSFCDFLALYRAPYENYDRTYYPGDLRLLVTRTAAGHKAVLYRAIVPGTPEDERVLFESPVGRVWFDEVRDVTAQVQVGASDGNYEIAVPLAALGLAVEKNKQVLGDIGILRGNGRESVQRVYWNNKAAQIVSDIPSEARLEPANWGILRCQEPASPTHGGK